MNEQTNDSESDDRCARRASQEEQQVYDAISAGYRMTKNIAEMAAEIKRLVELTTPRQRDLRIALHSVADRLEAAAQHGEPVAAVVHLTKDTPYGPGISYSIQALPGSDILEREGALLYAAAPAQKPADHRAFPIVLCPCGAEKSGIDWDHSGASAIVRWNTRAAPPASTGVVPEGWKLVPVEPTEAMRKAAVVCVEGSAVYKNVSEVFLKSEEDSYAEVYAAMLYAAPTHDAAMRADEGVKP